MALRYPDLGQFEQTGKKENAHDGACYGPGATQHAHNNGIDQPVKTIEPKGMNMKDIIGMEPPRRFL